MFPLQALPRCPEVDKPAASKAQDAKHAVLFPVVDGSATGAGGTVEQIGSFREKRQFDKLGFCRGLAVPIVETELSYLCSSSYLSVLQEGICLQSRHG